MTELIQISKSDLRRIQSHIHTIKYNLILGHGKKPFTLEEVEKLERVVLRIKEQGELKGLDDLEVSKYED